MYTHVHMHTITMKISYRWLSRVADSKKITFLVHASFLQDIKGLDKQHAANPIVLLQDHNQDFWGESQQETLPLELEPL